MKRYVLFWLALVAVLCASCGQGAPAADSPACPRPSGTPHYLEVPPELLPAPGPTTGAREVEIGGKRIVVDRVVEGPLCNDTWRGTVY
ncbi:MAG: hypothetical protein JXA93_03540, partial [Anaerolineae bacterium]|nr:hypothetical protein [Anaerolineae bacterium]